MDYGYPPHIKNTTGNNFKLKALNYCYFKALKDLLLKFCSVVVKTSGLFGILKLHLAQENLRKTSFNLKQL